MKRFTLLTYPCTTGFQENVTLDLNKPIEAQLHRRRINLPPIIDRSLSRELIKIIEWNSSLRIGFGWSFESTSVFRNLMEECEQKVKPAFIGNIVEIISDDRCDWLGFMPFNTFDYEYYRDLCPEDLVYFNNSLVDYQVNVMKFISSHTSYMYHAMVRDSTYRFRYFKSKRKNPVDLLEAFQYYVEALVSTTGLGSVSRDIVEDTIGCHYLYHPDVFFEILEFYKLKGVVYE